MNHLRPDQLRSCSPAKPSEANEKAELSLVLRKDGSWSDFMVIATHASSSGKDVGIRAETTDGQIVGTQTLMLRVRTNVEKLTVPERNAARSRSLEE